MTTSDGVTAWAGEWGEPRPGTWRCFLDGPADATALVSADASGFVRCGAPGYFSSAFAHVLAAVLLEAADLAEGGEVKPNGN